MKRLLLAPLLLTLLVGCSSKDKYTIYTTERPPSSWSGIIDSEGYYYWFTNGYGPAEKHKCDILAGETGNACFIKTNEKAEIINKDIIKAQGRYFCSEKHIKARNKANPVINPRQSFDYGYGKCTKDGWVR